MPTAPTASAASHATSHATSCCAPCGASCGMGLTAPRTSASTAAGARVTNARLQLRSRPGIFFVVVVIAEL